jgi:GntR family transcriptional regulator, histidine utilization repressor
MQHALTGRAMIRKGSENVTLHRRILNDIQRKILSGEWEPGRRIPVEHELLQQYGCSRMTVSKVLTQLAQAGIIERRRKAGSFVSRPHSQSAVLSIPDIKAEVGALGQPYSFRLLHRSKRRSTREDRALLATGDSIPVLEIQCQHLAGEQPFCFEYRLINVHAVPEAVEQDFSQLAPGAWLLRQVPWIHADHRIRSAGATAEVADILKIKPRTPCLIVERLTRATEGTVTFVRLTYPGTMHELVASFTPLGAGSSSPPAV